MESISSNARYAIGDSNRGEGGVTFESVISNARYALRDNSILTTSNKSVTSRFDNRIAVVAAIVDNITIFNDHGGEGVASRKSTKPNTRNVIRDSNRS